MEYFDKRMALDLIEDALTDLDDPQGRGMATGLCGAFYVCGLLSKEEWEAFLARIPADPHPVSPGNFFGTGGSRTSARGRLLN